MIKKITLYLIICAYSSISYSQKQTEVEAIKDFCGCFEVEFKYAETFSSSENYELKEPYDASALELVFIEEQTPGKIVLQHVLVINDVVSIKHWREDWVYEAENSFSYLGNEAFNFSKIPAYNTKGKWTQKVYGVYDEPRYSGSATWFLADDTKIWRNTSDSPLPRREYKTRKRKDYQILRRTNTLHINDAGWIHEQDNQKVALLEDGSEKVIVEEKGWNIYKRVDSSRCKTGKEWWDKNKKNWNFVREAWAEFETSNKSYQFHKRTEDGESFKRKTNHFLKEDYKSNEEAKQKILDITKQHSSEIAVKKNNIFLDREFWSKKPSIELIKQKINEGNNPTAFNSYKFDAVTWAILENNSIETIKFLLSIKGNEVDKITHDGRNYLMWSAYMGNTQLSKILIDKKSKINIIDDHGYGVITFASFGGKANTNLFELLIKNGAKINETNREGANAMLILNAHLKDDKMIKYFQQKGLDIQHKDNNGNGIFYYVARLGNIKMMKLLIDKKVPYNYLNNNEENAMLFASKGLRRHNNSLNVYTFLDSLGIEANVKNKNNQTPLHFLAYGTKDYEIFDFFIKKGTNIKEVDNNGNTAFLNACSKGNFKIANKINRLDSNINQQNKDGYTPLTYAVKNNSSKFVTYLIEKGADINVKDSKNNYLVYHLFDSYNPRKIEDFEFILNKLNTPKEYEANNKLLEKAIEKQSLYLTKQAIDLGVTLSKKNADGITPLHLAILKAKNTEIVTLLIKKGADKTIKTNLGESTFDLASENEILKGKGIDINFLK